MDIIILNICFVFLNGYPLVGCSWYIGRNFKSLLVETDTKKYILLQVGFNKHVMLVSPQHRKNSEVSLSRRLFTYYYTNYYYNDLKTTVCLLLHHSYIL